MKNSLLLGLFKWVLPLPRAFWQRQVAARARRLEKEIDFMTDEHHRVRNYAVLQLARSGVPLSPEHIAERLRMLIDRVKAILDELQKHLLFIYRNEDGAVVWAYPATVEKTPHRMILSKGEEIYAACAVDALAMPFVQGQLRGMPVSGHITTECAYCHKPLHILVDSDLHYKIIEERIKPVLFAPLQIVRPGEPSIIDCF